MMYPVAVNGHMPFVDAKKYRESQIKKVIAKHRQRHNSGPEKFSMEKNRMFNSNTRSLPLLSQDALLSPRIGRPRCISMPSLESQNNLVNNLGKDASSSTKQRIVQAIKQFFSKDCKDSKKTYQPQYSQHRSSRVRTYSAPVDILSRSRANVNGESNSPPSGISPKRQRTRTVSNISSVMETILEEIPENIVLKDDSDSDDSELNSNSSNSLASIMSSQSEPVITPRLSLSHLERTDSPLSQPNSTELICAA